MAGRSRKGIEAPRSQAEYSREARGGLGKETAMFSVAEESAPFRCAMGGGMGSRKGLEPSRSQAEYSRKARGGLGIDGCYDLRSSEASNSAMT